MDYTINITRKTRVAHGIYRVNFKIEKEKRYYALKMFVFETDKNKIDSFVENKIKELVKDYNSVKDINNYLVECGKKYSAKMSGENDYFVDITKTEKIRETHNSMVSNYAYLIHGRIYDKNYTRFKRFRFVVDFDGYDLGESELTKEEYRDELASHYLSLIKSINDTEEFYNECQLTIDNYNK